MPRRDRFVPRPRRPAGPAGRAQPDISGGSFTFQPGARTPAPPAHPHDGGRGRTGHAMRPWAGRAAWVSVRMILTARPSGTRAENRVIARISPRGTAPGASNVILTDTRLPSPRPAHPHTRLPPAPPPTSPDRSYPARQKRAAGPARAPGQNQPSRTWGMTPSCRSQNRHPLCREARSNGERNQMPLIHPCPRRAHISCRQPGSHYFRRRRRRAPGI